MDISLAVARDMVRSCIMRTDVTKEKRRAYLAAFPFTDENVGRVVAIAIMWIKLLPSVHI
jgi:hypothetical protein